MGSITNTISLQHQLQDDLTLIAISGDASSDTVREFYSTTRFSDLAPHKSDHRTLNEAINFISIYPLPEKAKPSRKAVSEIINNKFSVYSYPTYLLFDREGKFVHFWIGVQQESDFVQELQEIINGKKDFLSKQATLWKLTTEKSKLERENNLNLAAELRLLKIQKELADQKDKTTYDFVQAQMDVGWSYFKMIHKRSVNSDLKNAALTAELKQSLVARVQSWKQEPLGDYMICNFISNLVTFAETMKWFDIDLYLEACNNSNQPAMIQKIRASVKTSEDQTEILILNSFNRITAKKYALKLVPLEEIETLLAQIAAVDPDNKNGFYRGLRKDLQSYKR